MNADEFDYGLRDSSVSVCIGNDRIGGLIIDVHPDPENAFSGGVHSLLPREFAKLMEELKLYAPLMGKDIYIFRI